MTIAGDGGPLPSAPIISSIRARLRRPISAKSWRTVVNGGVKYCASGMSSKPTTLTCRGISVPAPGPLRGDLGPRLVQRAQPAERHLVVGNEDGAGRPVAQQPLRELVTRA